MNKTIFLIAASCISTSFCAAQLYIEPYGGYNFDLTNKSRLNQLNAGVMAVVTKNTDYEMFLLLNFGLPLNKKSQDSSFSTNPAVPLYSPAIKTISPFSVSLMLGHRIRITGNTGSGQLNILLSSGFVNQKIKVSYQYDKENYSILNPDKSLQKFGFSLGGGIEYLKELKPGRIFFQAMANTEPLTFRKTKFPSSFNFINSLSFNAGYSIPIKKKSHEKK